MTSSPRWCARIRPAFLGVAALPTADPHWAADELRRAHRELGFIGGSLPLNAFATHEGALTLAPLFAEAQKHGSHFFIHRGRPAAACRPAAAGGARGHGSGTLEPDQQLASDCRWDHTRFDGLPGSLPGRDRRDRDAGRVYALPRGHLGTVGPQGRGSPIRLRVCVGCISTRGRTRAMANGWRWRRPSWVPIASSSAPTTASVAGLTETLGPRSQAWIRH